VTGGEEASQRPPLRKGGPVGVGVAGDASPPTSAGTQQQADSAELATIWQRFLRHFANTLHLDTSSSVAGFLLGFLLVLLLLTCCSCCLYCCLLLWRAHLSGLLAEGGPLQQASLAERRQRLRRRLRMGSPASRKRAAQLGPKLAPGSLLDVGAARDQQPEGGRGHLMASVERQNEENAARLRLLRGHGPPEAPRWTAGPLGGETQRQSAASTQLQSILKRQPQFAHGAAPLARFETLKQRPADSPSGGAHFGLATAEPRAPSPPRRGALASSLTSATGRRRTPISSEPGGAQLLGTSTSGGAAPASGQDTPMPAQRRSRQPADSDTSPPPPTVSGAVPGQQVGGRQQAELERAASKELTLTSRATRVEQSSSTSSRRLGPGGQLSERKVTSYVYSQDTAQYSESYLLLGGRNSGPSTSAGDYVNLSSVPLQTEAQEQSEPEQTRRRQEEERTQGKQSSLI